MKQLDLHGKNRYEAKILIESFIYESYCQKEYFICVIHGYGLNIMYQTLKEILGDKKYQQYIDYYEFAPPQYGGSGSTIIYLKKG